MNRVLFREHCFKMLFDMDFYPETEKKEQIDLYFEQIREDEFDSKGEPKILHEVVFDEFDKAESTFYSAFYQLFDEGILIDKNYEVKLKNSIIICTSNYRNLLDIKKKLGEAIYSRFDDFIEFKTINYNNMANIAKQMYEKNLIKLNLEEQKIIEESEIFNTIIDNIKKFYNVRQLEKIIIQLIAKELLKNKLNDFENMNN